MATAECCCAYNMLKLTRQLYTWTGDPRYFDYYERVLLNHRLGTIRPETGATMYYLSLTPGAYKTFGTEDKSVLVLHRHRRRGVRQAERQHLLPR